MHSKTSVNEPHPIYKISMNLMRQNTFMTIFSWCPVIRNEFNGWKYYSKHKTWSGFPEM